MIRPHKNNSQLVRYERTSICMLVANGNSDTTRAGYDHDNGIGCNAHEGVAGLALPITHTAKAFSHIG